MELVENSGEFMLARLKECCETMLSLKEHRTQLIRDTVVASLPKLALYCPDAFVRGNAYNLRLSAHISSLLSIPFLSRIIRIFHRPQARFHPNIFGIIPIL